MALFKSKKVWFGNCTFSHIRPFRKSYCVIFLKCKKVPYWNVQFCTFLFLFKKEQLCNRTFFLTFQKGEKMWDRKLALSKKANVQKMCIFQTALFSHKKSDRTFSKSANAQPWSFSYVFFYFHMSWLSYFFLLFTYG